MLCVLHMDVCHEFYNMICFCRHENLLLEMCLLYLYFPPEWVWKYRGIYHNNVKKYPAIYPMMCIGTGIHCYHGHVCGYVVHMITMRSYTIITAFKNTTCYFTRTSILRVMTLVFELFHVKITPHWQGGMNTFGRYTTITTANYLLPCRNIV